MKTAEVIKLDRLIDELQEGGVDYKTLVVCIAGSETLVGEAVTEVRVGREVVLKNPKRFMRIQIPKGDMLMIDFLITDYDLIDEGLVNIQPSIAYRPSGQSLLMQIDFCTYYLSYLDKKRIASAKAAGLTLPSSGLLKR